MKACHITSDSTYRNPFGAAVLGGAVSLSLDVWDADVKSCHLRLWQEEVGETILEMQPDYDIPAEDTEGAGTCYSITLCPQMLGVLWYSFRLTLADGSVVWYGAEDGWTTGEGRLYRYHPASFQMTVYKPREEMPSWYTEGIVYQIFPDRFARDEKWLNRASVALRKPRKGPHRHLEKQWDVPPFYVREANGDVAQWDFYGGSLEGIREKFDYLQDLGVNVLYLNPIFEAASNHRYDTGDYFAIDPMLGTRETFTALCDEAHARGMYVILDGVFNHAGQDSRYFNAYGNYPDVGAMQGDTSPYRDWFQFNGDGTYKGWWGVKDLPEYNEDIPSLREFFCGPNGVVRMWLRAGADGWRLDVADELPDSFIEDIKAAALAEKPDALVIGEVWEDASNKYAYGKLRHYFQGTELDGVMNYPFRDVVIRFLTGAIHAPEAARILAQQQENYPPDAFACNLNLLGSHDRERILTVLGDLPNVNAMSEREKSQYRMDESKRGTALGRLKLAIMLQMTVPGVPSVYYGDEAGLEGLRDPYNRAAMPWDHMDKDIFNMYRSAVALRRSLPLLVRGAFEPVSCGNEVLGWWRCSEGQHTNESVCVLVNRSPWDWARVTVPATGECVSELGRAQSARIENGQVVVDLKPFDTSVLYFHPEQRLQKPMEPGKGIICHITSVPNGGEAGTLGSPSVAFVDWLAKQGYTYWQILPVNPTDACGSPYAGLSAFAGNPNLIEWPSDKEEYLRSLGNRPGYLEFCNQNAYWLEPYAAFCAIKAVLGEMPWQEWPELYRKWDPALLRHSVLTEQAERVCLTQYAFQIQWQELKEYANNSGIRIIGDLPMYVSPDSSDVWAHASLFDLDEKGYPASVAGCPPDVLAEDGQVWGNPTYRWDVMAQDGYEWWMSRLGRMFSWYDYVRLDHFLGFSSYYSIQAGQTAKTGTWKYGPGKKFFEIAAERFGGELPLIGENLGTITPAVRALVATCGFPGLDVIQFADVDPREYYRPAPGTLVYLSTHDTSTLVGWCQKRYGLELEDAKNWAAAFVARTLDEQSDGVVIMQLQDALLLGDEARMNVPGVANGNWSWRSPELP